MAIKENNNAKKGLITLDEFNMDVQTKKFKPSDLVKEFINKYDVCIDGDSIYIFDSSIKGSYVKVTKREVCKCLYTCIPEHLLMYDNRKLVKKAYNKLFTYKRYTIDDDVRITAKRLSSENTADILDRLYLRNHK